MTPGSRLEGTARRRNLGGCIAEPGLYPPANERALENIFLKKSRCTQGIDVDERRKELGRQMWGDVGEGPRRGAARVGRWFGQWERASRSRASRARRSARICTAWKPRTEVAACACPMLLSMSCSWLLSFRLALMGPFAVRLDK